MKIDGDIAGVGDNSDVVFDALSDDGNANALFKISSKSDRISADHITILQLHFQRNLVGFFPSMPLSII